MISHRDRPAGRHPELSLEGLIAHAHVLGSQGRRTIAQLKGIRARVEANRANAERTLMRATAALEGANERLRAIRAAAG